MKYVKLLLYSLLVWWCMVALLLQHTQAAAIPSNHSPLELSTLLNALPNLQFPASPFGSNIDFLQQPQSSFFFYAPNQHSNHGVGGVKNSHVSKVVTSACNVTFTALISTTLPCIAPLNQSIPPSDSILDSFCSSCSGQIHSKVMATMKDCSAPEDRKAIDMLMLSIYGKDLLEIDFRLGVICKKDSIKGKYCVAPIANRSSTPPSQETLDLLCTGDCLKQIVDMGVHANSSKVMQMVSGVSAMCFKDNGKYCLLSLGADSKQLDNFSFLCNNQRCIKFLFSTGLFPFPPASAAMFDNAFKGCLMNSDGRKCFEIWSSTDYQLANFTANTYCQQASSCVDICRTYAGTYANKLGCCPELLRPNQPSPLTMCGISLNVCKSPSVKGTLVIRNLKYSYITQSDENKAIVSAAVQLDIAKNAGTLSSSIRIIGFKTSSIPSATAVDYSVSVTSSQEAFSIQTTLNSTIQLGYFTMTSTQALSADAMYDSSSPVTADTSSPTPSVEDNSSTSTSSGSSLLPVGFGIFALMFAMLLLISF